MSSTKHINNTSPLRYVGGKTRACKILDKIFSDNFDVSKITKVVSPFFGGGSFEFYLQNKYGYKIKANDKFKPLHSFWHICKTDNKKMCDVLYDMHKDSVSKEDFMKFRNKIMDEKDIFIQSIHYFIINRCSFSGATLSGGFSKEASNKRFTKSSIDRIAKLDLSKFDIQCEDFGHFLDNNVSYDEENGNKNNNVLLFLDPPYFLDKNQNLYGNKGDMHEDFEHQKLSDILKKKKSWILTYNDCDYIRNLYEDYKILDVNWSYGINKSKKSCEIVIVNHSLTS
jgi:DNA adenine methylase